MIMNPSFIALIILAGLGLLVVVGGVAALCNKRTRWLGYLLLLLPVGLAALLVFRIFGFAILSGFGATTWSIFAMPVVAILVLGSIAALVALLVNERTRPIGFVLLAVSVVPVVLGCLAVVLLSSWHESVVSTVRQCETPKAIFVSAESAGSVGYTVSVEHTESVGSARPQAAKKTAPRKKTGRVIEAISTALSKTLTDFNSARTKQAEAVSRLKAAPARKTTSRKTTSRRATSRKTPTKKPTSVKQIPSPKKAAAKIDKKIDKKTAEKKLAGADSESGDTEDAAAEDAEDADAEDTDVNADRISKMVEVLSGAVRQELPENMEIDQFTALRALGRLLGRMIASEQQKTEAVADVSDVENASTTTVKPAAGLETRKTSAVAVSAEKVGASNDKRPSGGKTAKAPARPVDSKTSSPLKKEPDWVEAQPQRVGDAYQVVFMVGPYTTRFECEQALNGQLASAVADYAVLYFGSADGSKATLDTSYLRDHVIKDQWEETFQSSVGPMVRVHTRLLFDGKANVELKESYRKATIEERLWYAGGGLGAILIVLAGCFAVLKFDQATDGDYRGRMVLVLFFAVVITTAVAGTRFLIELRPVAVPVSADRVYDVSTDSIDAPRDVSISPSDAVSSERPLRATATRVSSHDSAQAQGGGGYGRPSKLLMLAAALSMCLLVVMLFFRKTRKIALVLLSMGVVLAVGALVLVVWSV